MCSIELFTDETSDTVRITRSLREGSFLSEDGLLFYTTTTISIAVERGQQPHADGIFFFSIGSQKNVFLEIKNHSV